MKTTATNTTIRNLTKQKRLSKEHILPKHIIAHTSTVAFLQQLLKFSQPKEEIIYNLGKHLVKNNSNPILQNFLKEYSYPEIVFTDVPEEFDLLGAAYQFLNTKYENLTLGSFYTSKDLAFNITKGLSFSHGETLIDLSCGSGVFLFAGNIPEDKIFGVDFDSIAVMIAKFNFFIKFPQAKIYPQIFQADFLEWYQANKDKRFTYVVGNPPYGANLNISKAPSVNITTGESFSYFIEYGFSLLEEKGSLHYLIPEALLNVKRHVDIRNFILDKTNLTKVQLYNTKFAGVMSDIYLIELNRNKSKKVQFVINNEINHIKKVSLKELKNHIFYPITEPAAEILKLVKKKCSTNLQGSRFALGVVTGDNQTKLLDVKSSKTEPIFTGKEIGSYKFLPVKKHIVFDRKNLQQVAPEEIYRANSKIVYKVISKRLKVVIDHSGSLTSSSANIIIPNVQGNNEYSISLLLNSHLYSFVNQKLHGGVNKISRENLEALPLPMFTVKELDSIEQNIKAFLTGLKTEQDLQEHVYDYFGLSVQQILFVESSLNA